VQPDHRLDAGALRGVEVPARGEIVGQRPAAVAGPGPEGGDELVLVDQAILQGEQSEEQVAVGTGAVNGSILAVIASGVVVAIARGRSPRGDGRPVAIRIDRVIVWAS